MAFECLVPFLESSTFQNLHAAGLRDIDLGINQNMLLLGAEFDLQPCDLLKIIHDKNNKLTRDKVMELLNAGVTSIAYISDFYRLCDLGYSMNEILILLHGSIPVENIIFYDLVNLYNALGFTDICNIKFLIRNGAQPEKILHYLENGFSVDDYGAIPIYIKSGISATQVLPFFEAGIKRYSKVNPKFRYKVNPKFRAKSSGFLASNITKYIKYCISPTDAVCFNSINVHRAADIIEYKNSGLSAKQISPMTMLDRFAGPKTVMEYIKSGLSATDYLRHTRPRRKRR